MSHAPLIEFAVPRGIKIKMFDVISAKVHINSRTISRYFTLPRTAHRNNQPHQKRQINSLNDLHIPIVRK